METNTPLAKTIRRVLANCEGVRSAIVFGSLARGSPTSRSDLDLAVLMATPLSVDAKMTMIGDLADALGRPVDLLDLRTVGEPLLGQILRYGIRILGSDADHAELIKRHLFADADFMPYQRRILAERRQAWIGK